MVKIERATIGLAAATLLSGAVTAAVHATAFTPGDIVVTRGIGGAVDLTTTPAPGSVAPIATPGPLLGNGVAATVELDEYTPSGTLVQSITLPNVQQTDTTAGNTYALTFSGTQNNEGTIEISGDGKYFTLIGYNQTAGVTGSNGVASTTIQRVVGLVNMNGTVNTTTGLQDVSSSQSPRSAYTTNGTDLWVGGSSGGNVTIATVYGGVPYSSGGVHYTTIGSTTSVALTNGNTNQRIIQAIDFGSGPQLLLSSNASGTQTSNTTTGGVNTGFRGIATIDLGLPKSEATVVNPVQLPGFENTNEPAAHETADNYWFKDKNTLYIADQRNTSSTGGATGGVQKWTFTGDTNSDGIPDSWAFAYNVTLGLGVANATTGVQNPVGGHGLSGRVDPFTGKVNLFVTTFDGTGANSSLVYEVVDNGTSFDPLSSPLATSATNSAFRGVAIVPYILGDANVDNHVDLTDLSIVLNNFGATTSLRSQGNFDGAATIDLTDLSDVLNNFGVSFPGASASPSLGAAPEPASLAVLGLGVAGVLIRRRRA